MARNYYKKKGNRSEKVSECSIPPYYYNIGRGRDRIRSLTRAILIALMILGVVIGSIGWVSFGIYYAVIGIASFLGFFTVLPRGFNACRIVERISQEESEVTGWAAYSSSLPLIVKTRDNLHILVRIKNSRMLIIVTDSSRHLPLPFGSKGGVKIRIVGKKVGKRNYNTPLPVKIIMVVPRVDTPRLYTRYDGEAIVMHVRRTSHLTTEEVGNKILECIRAYRKKYESVFK